MNIMDGFLTTHLERTFYKHESELIREFLARPTTSLTVPPRRSAFYSDPRAAACPR